MPTKLIGAIISLWTLAASATVPLPRLIDLAGTSFTSNDPRIVALYFGALKNLESQFIAMNDSSIYVSTGDIPAMWLRDSSVQVRPFLFFAKNNSEVRAFLKGVVLRQARGMAKDPYANAFKRDYSIWERKYELDSLANPILLAWTYWKVTNDDSIFTPEVIKGFEVAVDTMLKEQNHDADPHYYHQELRNNPVAYTGMIWSGFRPSDDGCEYNYLIPSEMMTVQALGAMAEIERTIFKNYKRANSLDGFRKEVNNGIERFGIIKTEKYGDVYAYEVDGLGNYKLMDDGNLPSLLSAPWYGYLSHNDPIYQNTRRFVLSKDNPFFFEGTIARGVGSPHTRRGMVWPLALLAQALTTNDQAEFNSVLEMLVQSNPGDNVLHESFDPSNPRRFTRKDFGWPNAMLIELLLTRFSGFSDLPVVPAPEF
jgi:uncharacterized protein